LWARRPGFATLVRIILEQQVSLASARATFNRLENRIGGLTAERVRTLGPTALRALGLTRQKARYLIELADAVSDGWLDLRGLGRLDDAQARTALMAVSGIGPWTADVYLLEALRRPDVWPTTDLALAKAVQILTRRPARPSRDDLEAIGAAWRPLRSVAARMLWHYYLSGFEGEQGR
jgi:DNA-3-methyladenine glycosylase II